MTAAADIEHRIADEVAHLPGVEVLYPADALSTRIRVALPSAIGSAPRQVTASESSVGWAVTVVVGIDEAHAAPDVCVSVHQAVSNCLREANLTATTITIRIASIH